MFGKYTKNVAPYVQAELDKAARARLAGDIETEFNHYENAHVIGQASTYWHVKVHVLMLQWAVRNIKVKESLGQTFRIVGAATKTLFGMVPTGNTGGTNVSPFKSMPIKPEHQKIIFEAKHAE